MKPTENQTVTIDLSTPEKMDDFCERFDRVRPTSPDQPMDFGSFVRAFNNPRNGAGLRAKK